MELDVLSLLKNHPEMMLFLVIGLGYLIGKIGAFGINLGSSIGVLFVALLFGHLGFAISPIIGTIGFIFFIYSVGYQAGPSFFATFRTDGVRYIQIGLVIALVAIATAVVGAWIFDLEQGYAAGALAGGLTSTPTLAAAQDAIRSGMAEVQEGFTAERVEGNIAVGYAVTYIFGLLGLIVFLQLVPRLLRFDLQQEAQRFAQESAGGRPARDDEMGLGSRGMPSTRVFAVTTGEAIGKSLLDLLFLQKTGAVIARLQRHGEDVELGPETGLQQDDRALVLGYNANLVKAANLLGPEVTDPALEQTAFETCRIQVNHPGTFNCTLRDTGVTNVYACVTQRVTRAGVDLPVSLEMLIQRGDVLTVSGPSTNIERLVQHLGQTEKPVHETDLITFAFGIVVGLLVGFITVKVGNLPLSIGSAGGLLIAGLVVGWARGINPFFGRVPAAARYILMELGLLLFLAGVGLRAGSGLLEGLRSAGVPLFVTGAFVTLLPVLAGALYGRYALKLNPAILLGAICGGITSTPALGAITRQAKSDIPAMGYVGVYAFANIILTLAGQLIMLL